MPYEILRCVMFKTGVEPMLAFELALNIDDIESSSSART